WDSRSKWDCVRSTAPNRKPALGYYDEGNPECVDWQIKWAVENAISCFLVDWYWCDGKQQLTQWFDAYRKAKYRDLLKVAIMWANHNPPGTHSAEDFRNVTREWIDKYFNLPGYFRINGKPAVFIWAPSNIRADLKGSDAVKKSMDDAQELARKAGYPGITFVAMGYDFSKQTIDALIAEGYTGVTTYHEWGALQNAQGPQRLKFEDVVKTAGQSWADKNKAAGSLAYYPVIDTGWDSRPWHGDKALVLEGRTSQLFYQLLQGAWQFAVDHDKKVVILGPLNEWGEGSYIEPCVEFGFKMYEAVREVFALGAERPVNIAPSDVHRGPYDYPDPKAAPAG
ncbi:MAG: glycoside hydrolase family 99-like domain-containing protein, partial [Candidatus Hydrogenedentes bacterium]|nr:glycoside hydrolase family 99-like domain-containing protein [Candidatus Hydrogenedentota bacterium]